MAKSELSKQLDLVHGLLVGAAFLIVMQIVRRRFRKTDAEKAAQKCRAATKLLERMLG